ncbi:MAG: hypothetical protein Q7T74_04935, partial [Candidatus Saccharibacteria bacterium]|nr:hypothetical protein [Candidatus Saccharibacteria bacterium]
EHAAYYKVGTDQGGGNESSTYTWTGSTEQWYGIILRITDFNSSDPVSGTEGTGSGAADATPIFPATTPDSDASLVVKATGADDDIPDDTGWMPTGHTLLSAGNSNSTVPGDTADCGFAAASLDSPPASGVSTGTTSLISTSIFDTYGASTIAINPSGSVSPPQVQSSTQTLQNTDSANFTMSMPATRPAGDLYIALMCHDGSNGSGSPGGTSGNNIGAPSGGGWTEYADLQGHAAYYKIGADAGGGNEAASYTWTGNSENWAGVIVRVTGFDTSDPVSGTPGQTWSTTNATPQYPATTPDNSNTLVIRSVGADADEPSATAWVPASHTKVASGGSTGANDCAYNVARMNTAPASGVSTGTATMADTSISDDYGSSSIAINPTPTSASISTRSSVNWAQFDSTTYQIESPNPGTGVCDGWCTDAAYDLPSSRKAHTTVAYNGYLYVMGGSDSSSARVSTVYIAKLGANGEPQLWHPTDTNPDNWEYWYTDSGLNGSTAKNYFAAVAYNNRMYVVGGETDASPNGITTVEMADILPNGRLGTWTTTGMQALPAGAGTHMHGVQVYNDTLYTMGGFEGARTSSANMRSAVYYSRLDSDGDMNAWQSTNSFTTARVSYGGTFSYISSAYIYMSGGCTGVNASGYCNAFASDIQVASINADGSIDSWIDLGVGNSRIGYNLVGWQGGLYRIGGCTQIDTSTGQCKSVLADVDYGTVNPAGEVSTVSISVASGSAPCSGGSAYNCNLPPPGDDAGEAGQLLTMTAILNGHLYSIGGCIDYDCNGTNPASDDSNASGNIAYVAINSDGRLVAPSACSGTSYGAWCVDSTNRINGTTGIAAGGVTTFNNRIYIVGGLTGAATSTNIYYNDVNTDGSLNGAWESVDSTLAGLSTDLSYTYIYSRANPSSNTYPGNLYIFGGCDAVTTGLSCGASGYSTEVYKCNITAAGAIEVLDTDDCTTSGQLQIDSDPSTGGSQGLGIHSGTVNANYVYLIGGYSDTEADKDEVMYAKIDDSNNIVAVSGATWIESPNTLNIGRRRGYSFGYNGHIYSVGGYDGNGSTNIIPFIEWSKMDVSDGSIDEFITSSITINQRWGLSIAVSNSYAYVIGGCDVGDSPSGCSSFEERVQIFQLYNNDSGTPASYNSMTDDTYATNTDRIGSSAAIYDGYIYVAGGCTAINCSTVSDNVQRAPISAADGSIGTWADTTDSTLPAQRAFGQLEIAGGTLYYAGGIDATGDEKADVYFGPVVSNNISTWTATTTSLPADRAYHGGTVWNDRLYMVGGIDDSAAVTSTVYVSPQMSSGGDITGSWTSTTAFDVARTGPAVTAYANNLYLFGGYDGTKYLNDSQFTQINSDGTVDAWTFSTSLPVGIRDANAVSANGYIYVVAGRTAASTCTPKTLVAPVVANTTIATGNNPTGVGEWYESNTRYTGDRYGSALAYDKGKLYIMGGGCSSLLTATRHYYAPVKSQPQVAIYSRMIDTDTDVFPTSWLMNGLDNSIGARWQVKYRSMHDLDSLVNPTEDCGTSATMAQMTTWGQETNFGNVTLGDVASYMAADGTVEGSLDSGDDINCARYFYFFVSIDASKTFGYPEDVNRGPTIADLSLFFTSDPNKRLRHGKTFTGGEQQPLDTPCRQSEDPECPLP